MNIGERIRTRRKELGKTLEEVGKELNVSKQTIQRYESGEIKNIPYDKLDLLAKVLNCNGADFFFNVEFREDKYNAENAKILNYVKNNSNARKLIHSFMELSEEQQKSIQTIVESLAKNNP